MWTRMEIEFDFGQIPLKQAENRRSFWVHDSNIVFKNYFKHKKWWNQEEVMKFVCFFAKMVRSQIFKNRGGTSY